MSPSIRTTASPFARRPNPAALGTVSTHPVRGRGPGRRLTRLAGGSVLFAALTALLLLTPNVGAYTPVVLKRPYSGTGFTMKTIGVVGKGCIGNGNNLLYGPAFNLVTGRGSVSQESFAGPCATWTYQGHQLWTYFGFNSTAFKVNSTVKHASVKFRWTLSYALNVNTTTGGGNNSAYAFASVAVGGTLVDQTTKTSYPGANYFYNYTYIFDKNGSIGVIQNKAIALIFVNTTLLSTDTYVLETWVQTHTEAQVFGQGPFSPTGAAASATFHYQGGLARLDRILY